MNWNFGTFFICHPGIFTFRLLGFGLYACDREKFPLFQSQADRLWMIPITPRWHFCLVAPWI